MRSAFFLLLALLRLRPAPLDRRRVTVRLVPMAASLALVTGVAIAWWSVLPADCQE